MPNKETKPPSKRCYIGDGLYAEYDGYQLKLAASNGVCDTDIIYLEPAVLQELLDYAKRMRILK